MIEILTEYRGAFTAVLVALIALGGAFPLQRYLVIRNAVHTFKSAFSDCTAAIANDSFSIDTFSRDFDRHKAAVDTIRPLLPKRHQRKLQKAWDEYRGKGTDLGFDDKGFVEASSAMVYFAQDATNRQLWNDFKKRFHTLHGCLDDLL